MIGNVYLTSATGWTWNIVVSNAGVADAGVSQTRLVTASGLTVFLDTPALAAGDSVTLTTECPYGSIGQATATADATEVLQESDETNNVFTSELDGTVGRCRYP